MAVDVVVRRAAVLALANEVRQAAQVVDVRRPEEAQAVFERQALAGRDAHGGVGQRWVHLAFERRHRVSVRPAAAKRPSFQNFHSESKDEETDPEWARTTNLRLRRPTLYPIELRDRSCRPPIREPWSKIRPF